MPLPGDYAAGGVNERGGVEVSVTARYWAMPEDDGPEAVADDAPERAELGRGIRGIIDAYRMGAALDAQDLYKAGGSPDTREGATVVRLRPEGTA